MNHHHAGLIFCPTVKWGAAKLLPVAVIQAPSAHATRTSIPGAPNSTGGSGL